MKSLYYALVECLKKAIVIWKMQRVLMCVDVDKRVKRKDITLYRTACERKLPRRNVDLQWGSQIIISPVRRLFVGPPG